MLDCGLVCHTALFPLCGQLIVYVWKFERIALELLDVVEYITDAIHRHFGQVVQPLVNQLEDSLVLVCLANVLNNILTVGAVNTKHLSRITFILKLLEYLSVNSSTQLEIPACVAFEHHSAQRDANHDQELLVNVEHQVLEVRIYTRLRVDCCLLIGQQVVELDDTDGDSLKFLCFEHDLFQLRIFDYLIGYNCGEMSSFCDVPPIITVQRCI